MFDAKRGLIISVQIVQNPTVIHVFIVSKFIVICCNVVSIEKVAATLPQHNLLPYKCYNKGYHLGCLDLMEWNHYGRMRMRMMKTSRVIRG